MGLYKYRARDEQGRSVSGAMQAQDERDLHDKLKQEKLYLTTYRSQTEKKNTRPLRANEISGFAKNIGELLTAGVTLVKALRIVSEDEAIRPKEREVYADLLKKVRTGQSLSDAMAEQGDAFPQLFVNMIRSAESSGSMDQVALQMSVHYDKEYRLNQKVKSSMTYPKLLCVLIIAAVGIIMGYVIPQFDGLFSRMDQLPLTTRILLAISGAVTHKWYVILLVGIVAYIGVKLLLAIPAVRLQRDKALLKLPVIGKLQRVIYTARFARTLSSLYSAGISIISCLQIARDTIGNLYIERQFEQVIADVRAGNNLSEAVRKVDGFTRKISSTIAVGEESGSLDHMLTSIADQLDYDAEMALNRMVAYLEPAMIVIMAAVIGFIIIAVIQPIYGSYETIANSY